MTTKKINIRNDLIKILQKERPLTCFALVEKLEENESEEERPLHL